MYNLKKNSKSKKNIFKTRFLNFSALFLRKLVLIKTVSRKNRFVMIFTLQHKKIHKSSFFYSRFISSNDCTV